MCPLWQHKLYFSSHVYNCSSCWAYNNIWNIFLLTFYKIFFHFQTCLNTLGTCSASHLRLSTCSVYTALCSISCNTYTLYTHKINTVFHQSIYPCTAYFFNVPTHSISADSSSHIFLKTPNSLGSHRSDCSYQFLFITSAIDQLTTDWWLSFHFHNERNYHHYSYVQ